MRLNWTYTFYSLEGEKRSAVHGSKNYFNKMIASIKAVK